MATGVAAFFPRLLIEPALRNSLYGTSWTLDFEEVQVDLWNRQVVLVEPKLQGEMAEKVQLTGLSWSAFRRDENGTWILGAFEAQGLQVYWPLENSGDKTEFRPQDWDLSALPPIQLNHLFITDSRVEFGDWRVSWDTLALHNWHAENAEGLAGNLNFRGLKIEGPTDILPGQIAPEVLSSHLTLGPERWGARGFQFAMAGVSTIGDATWHPAAGSWETDSKWAFHWAELAQWAIEGKWMDALPNPIASVWPEIQDTESRAQLEMRGDSVAWQLELSDMNLPWDVDLRRITFSSADTTWTAEATLPQQFMADRIGEFAPKSDMPLVVRGSGNEVDLVNSPSPGDPSFHLHFAAPHIPHSLDDLSATIDFELNGLSLEQSPLPRYPVVGAALRADLTPGKWEILADFTGQTASNQSETLSIQSNWVHGDGTWSGTAATQMNGDWMPLDGQLSAAFSDFETWELIWDGNLKGIRPLPDSDLPIHSGVHLEIGSRKQFSGSTAQRWEGTVELRNTTLLRGHLPPLQIQRFDLFGHWNRRQFELEWASDLGRATLSGDGRWDKWMAWVEAQEARDLQVAVPAASVNIEFTRMSPIAALLELPLELPAGSQLSWRSSGDSPSFEGAFTSEFLKWEDKLASGVHLDLDGSMTELFINIAADSLKDGTRKLAADLAIDLHADTVWTADVAWQGDAERPSAVRFQLDLSENEWAATLFALDFPIKDQTLSLLTPTPTLTWSPRSQHLQAPDLEFSTGSGLLQINSLHALGDSVDVQAFWTEPHFPDLTAWGLPPVSTAAMSWEVEACGTWDDLSLGAHVVLEDWNSPAGPIQRIEGLWNGSLDEGTLWLDVREGEATVLGIHGQHMGVEDLDATISFQALPARWLNPVLESGTVALDGTLSGGIRLTGNPLRPKLQGVIDAQNIHATVGYLGTDLVAQGQLEIGPDHFAFDNWQLLDASNRRGSATGTVLHENFEDWNFDISLDLSAEPFQIMNLGRQDNDIFFGTAVVTGWGNVSGSDRDLRIEAELKTTSGSVFALPMDRISTPSYADYIRFKTQERVDGQEDKGAPEDLAQIRLKLGIDVTEAAQARIIFNEALGDEIYGRTKGHLDLIINDFERFEMNGGLEVIEGHYNLALSGLIQRRFDVDPGGTITWLGDPYGGEMDLTARHTVRTRLDNLLPGTSDLPGRVPVDLKLDLNGALLRPDISFDVEVPRASPQLQALVDNALFDEDEKNRQAISLLALGQFISPDPNVPLIADVSLTEQSTALLTAQLGNWLSSFTGGVDVGLNYGSNDLSGEQEVALALSTQLLDDRLHIEGEAKGTAAGATASTDLSLQDLRIAYDLTEDGRLQISGYRETQPGFTGADGTTTMGIGLRFRQQFDRWGDLFNRKE